MTRPSVFVVIPASPRNQTFSAEFAARLGAVPVIVTTRLLEVVVASLSSVATAASVTVPGVSIVIGKRNGAAVAVPTIEPLASKSTREIVPSSSTALTTTVKFAGAALEILPDGVVIDTIGAEFKM